MKLVSLFAVTLLISQVSFANFLIDIPINPNVDLTPGDMCSKQDKDFYDVRYPEKMIYCKRNVSQGKKGRIYTAYSIPEKCRHRYTVDHLVPLALGGNNSPENLWPEHVLVKATRQLLEQELYLAVSRGDMRSDDAIEILLREKLKLVLDLSHINGCG